MKLIPGEKIAEKIKREIKEEISRRKILPKLVILYIGNNPASEIYINKKTEAAAEVGIETQVIRKESSSTAELVELVEKLNSTKRVSGMIIQLPIPKDINLEEVLEHIDPSKDVDGLNPLSLGKLWQANTSAFAPATPMAVLECLKYAAIYEDAQYSAIELREKEEKLLSNYLSGKKVLIINHSIIVGKPLAALLLGYKATLTIAHKDTGDENLRELINDCDIIISGTGISSFIQKRDIRDGQVLIDVGINKLASGVGGDIDPTGFEDKDVFLTPVPGGVGPITVAMLLKNTLKAAR